MLIVGNECYIHLRKTAGSSLFYSVQRDNGDNLKFHTNHSPLHLLPTEYKNCNIHAIIRNPLSWYESIASFLIQKYTLRGNIGGFYRYILFDGEGEGQIPEFDVFVDRLINFKEFTERVDLKRTIQRKLSRGNKSFIKIYPNKNDIHFKETFLQDELSRYGLNDDKIIWTKMEDGNAMEDLFHKFGCETSVVNKRKDGFNFKLNREQINLIQEKDKMLFDKFGYKQN